MRTIPSPVRVAIVGAGHVGSTFGYALLLRGLANEIVLIDPVSPDRAEGEAMDVSNASPFAQPTRIWAGTIADCAGAAVTVITAGVAQKPGESRADLARTNAAIVRQFAADVARHNPDGVLLVVTNPVDAMTSVALEASGLAWGQVIGAGTVLDTARLRELLGEHLAVDPRSVHAYVIGEHGDGAVPVWSQATVGGSDLAAVCVGRGVAHGADAFVEIERRMRDAAGSIIERIGSTQFGVASALVRIVEAIIRGEGTVLSVSTPARGAYQLPDVCVSLPTIVGRSGAESVLHLPLEPDELRALRRSAATIQETVASVAEADGAAPTAAR